LKKIAPSKCCVFNRSLVDQLRGRTAELRKKEGSAAKGKSNRDKYLPEEDEKGP